jgi:hypothetical protein
MEIRNLLEIVLNTLRPVTGAIVDDGLPAFFAMKGDNVVHLRSVAVTALDLRPRRSIAEVNTGAAWSRS